MILKYVWVVWGYKGDGTDYICGLEGSLIWFHDDSIYCHYYAGYRSPSPHSPPPPLSSSLSSSSPPSPCSFPPIPLPSSSLLWSSISPLPPSSLPPPPPSSSKRCISLFNFMLRAYKCCLSSFACMGQKENRRYTVGLESVDRINVTQHRDDWQAFVTTVMNLQVPWNARNFLMS